MKPSAFITSMLVSLVSLLLCISVIVLAVVNERQQNQLQVRQQVLNSGVLGQQAQQISREVVQELGIAARFNPAIRSLLVRHGFEIPPVATRTPSESPSSPSVTP